MPFDPYNIDPFDPRMQAMLAQMRGGAPGMQPGQRPPQMQGLQMPQQAPVQAAPMQNGPAPQSGGLDPAMVDQVMALQGQGTQRAGLDRQYKQADAMRASAADQLQSRRGPKLSTGGELYVGPNWANGLASVAGNVMADRRTAAADKAGAGLDSQRQAAAKKYLAALQGNGRRKPDEDDYEMSGGY